MSDVSKTSGPADAPTQRRRERTARDLLEAARRVLALKGYHKTKIADIAASAAVGVGTFYLYYPTKAAIFMELVDDTARKLKKHLDEARAASPDPAVRARVSTETFFRFAQDHRELFRIVFGHEAGFHDVVRAAQSRFVDDTIANLKAGMELGVFRRNEPEIAAHAIIGMSISVVSWWLQNEHVPIDRVTRSLTDLAFHGLTSPKLAPTERRS